MADDDAWFAQRRCGYGAGFPITWQGWLVTILYLGVVGAAALEVKDRPEVFYSILASATILFLAVALRKTRGGWYWRWDCWRRD